MRPPKTAQKGQVLDLSWTLKNGVNPLDGTVFLDTASAFVKAFLHLLAGEGVWGRGRHLSPFGRKPFRGQFFVIEMDDFPNRLSTFTKLSPNRDNLLHDYWGPRGRLQDPRVSALHTLGDGHLSFARQKRYGAHFA